MVEKIHTERFSRQLKSGLALFLLSLVLIFALQNSESVSVVFLLWEMNLPRALILFVFFLAGFLLGAAVINLKSFRQGK